MYEIVALNWSTISLIDRIKIRFNQPKIVVLDVLVFACLQLAS